MRWTFFSLLVVVGLGSAAEPKRAGADWWALQPLSTVAPPEGHQHPVDAFLGATLAAKKLKPVGLADKPTLIRRVTFDLLGLPPTLAEIEAFVKDDSPVAYEKLVERLLSSPLYGERWGRHWLDVARFSESTGFEYDRLRENSWRYRDYVIRSFNSDQPYADFVREQLAGDVWRESKRDGVLATGFLVSGPYDQAGQGAPSPLVRAKAREDELEEMLGTVGQTFLGVTLNCARCAQFSYCACVSRS